MPNRNNSWPNRQRCQYDMIARRLPGLIQDEQALPCGRMV
jgi:hypothetical protein